ncbi:MAG: UDP-N-acetylmuramate dehydrogenase, partial [Deltaproteobacteria bacterium CG11_big_fil_rev_8_21_14_0_20_45_16]
AGSDLACYPPVSDLLARLNIEVNIGYNIEHLKAFNPDYVVIGNFVRKDNGQAQYVKEAKLEFGSMPSTLEDLFLKETRNFVVVGTHGKSTTTTCLAYLLESAGRDPSFFVGAVALDFGQSFKIGDGQDFVLEGDEYDTAFFDKESKFLHYRPRIGVWTSFEFDHADIFEKLEDIEVMFQKFIKLLPDDGALIYCQDWDAVHRVVESARGSLGCHKIISYGFHPEADRRIENFEEGEFGLRFRLDGLVFESCLSGQFNAQNLVGATLAAKEAGLSDVEVVAGVRSFRGLKRRQEVRARIGRHLVIDDFAHHPTAIREVTRSLKQRYPDKTLVVLFEARSNTTRRKIFQKEFESAFAGADVVLLPQIFKPEALPENDRLDISRLIKSLQMNSIEARGPLSTDQLVESCVDLSHKFPCAFLLLSNGSFDGLHEKLISTLKSQ